MKPHEETWQAEGEDISIVDGTPEGGHFVGREFTPERAKLAAQAPAMARILLSELRNDPIGFKEGLDQIRAVLRDAGVIP